MSSTVSGSRRRAADSLSAVMSMVIISPSRLRRTGMGYSRLTTLVTSMGSFLLLHTVHAKGEADDIVDHIAVGDNERVAEREQGSDGGLGSVQAYERRVEHDGDCGGFAFGLGIVEVHSEVGAQGEGRFLEGDVLLEFFGADRHDGVLLIICHRSTRTDTVLTGRNAPIPRQVPWQYDSITCGPFLVWTHFCSGKTAPHLSGVFVLVDRWHFVII
nr:MAG TPA: hypothetical protein [Caudoviricetes sp.]